MELLFNDLDEAQELFDYPIAGLISENITEFIDKNLSLFNDKTTAVTANMCCHKVETRRGLLGWYIRFDVYFCLTRKAWVAGVNKMILFDKEPEWMREDRKTHNAVVWLPTREN